MTANFPNTSFMNLFNNIVYDSDLSPNACLDIWDAYVISPFYSDQIRYFETHKISASDTWVSIATQYYDDQRLWWLTPLFNYIENPFLVMDRDIFLSSVNEVKILQPQYVNSLLMQARQTKIQNDRDFSKGDSTNG